MAKIATTKIAGRPDIELPAFNECFERNYRNCELQAAELLVKNARTDWVYIDRDAGVFSTTRKPFLVK